LQSPVKTALASVHEFEEYLSSSATKAPGPRRRSGCRAEDKGAGAVSEQRAGRCATLGGSDAFSRAGLMVQGGTLQFSAPSACVVGKRSEDGGPGEEIVCEVDQVSWGEVESWSPGGRDR